jgi:hypothetical protein
LSWNRLSERFIFYSRQAADMQRRRMQLVNKIQQKDQRTRHFIHDKQETQNLVCYLSNRDNEQHSLPSNEQEQSIC